MILLFDPLPSYYHSFVQLEGHVEVYEDITYRTISVQYNVDSHGPQTTHSWPLINMRFKVIVQLTKVGSNKIKLFLGEDALEAPSIEVDLNFQPKPVDADTKLMRLLYVSCPDSQDRDQMYEEGRFQSPPDQDNSMDSACKRMATAALLVQCFYAQSLGCTFQLETEPDMVTPKVSTLLLDPSLDEIQIAGMGSKQIWSLVAQEVISNPRLYSTNCKFLAFCSFSRYRIRPDAKMCHFSNPSLMVDGFVCLGGGNLAVLSTHCMYTWPESLEDLVKNKLLDKRFVDQSLFMNDSGHR